MLGDRRRLELAYSLMFSLPGTPVLRYGDEIGMGDDLRLEERDGDPDADAVVERAERRLLRRREARAAGRLGRAVRLRDGQRRAAAPRPGSLLQWTTRMIRLRKECPEVGWGAWEVVPTRLPNVLGLLYRWRGNTLLTLHNLDARRAG